MLAFGEGLDLLVLESEFLDLLLRAVGGDFDDVAHLAIDREGDLDRIEDELTFVIPSGGPDAS